MIFLFLPPNGDTFRQDFPTWEAAEQFASDEDVEVLGIFIEDGETPSKEFQ